ncbi:MAG: biotin--[acetyl-CoA-carboxylase] ligase [Nevskiales bacterium]
MSLPAWRLKLFETLASTSDLCRELAEAGEPEGLAVLARRQERGRGTHGRSWISAPGNLFLSALLRPGGAARDAAVWSLLAGVALIETLDKLVPDPTALTLKWPNDVLLHGEKLAGILLDSAADARGGLAWLVIGFGANLAAAPDVSGRSVAALGTAEAPETVAWRLLARLDHWRGVLGREGFAPVREEWLTRAHPMGAPITLALSAGTLDGSFAGLGDDGRLLLQHEGRLHAFAAGEVLQPGGG